MSDPEFAFTPNANPVIELGLGDTRVPTGTGVWDSALWDNSGAVWQGVEPAWWNVSCFAIEADIARGRERATDRFIPGTASVVLDNTDGWADMAGTPGQIAAVSLRPGRAVRVGVDVHSIGVVWLFRGVIDKVTPTYDPVHPDYVKLDCIDLLGEVGHVKLPASAPVGGDDTPVARINRILDACKHPAEKRVLDTGGPAVKLVQTSYGAQAVDLLGQAADSAGGIVYGDEAGNVVYKPYGWQSYAAGEEPNGGAIGNVVAGTPGTPAFTPEPYLDAAGPSAAFKSALGSAVATAGGTALVITTTAAIAVGDLVVVRVAADNLSATTPTFTCADSGGNTYTTHQQLAGNAVAGAGIAGALIAAKATTAIAVGGTITVTLSGAVAAQAAYAESFVGIGNVVTSTPVGTVTTNGAIGPVTSGTVNRGDLVLAWGAFEANSVLASGDTDTLNGPWSSVVTLINAAGGTSSTRVQVSGQYKLPTAAGAQTWGSGSATSDCCGGLVVLQGAGGGAPVTTPDAPSILLPTAFTVIASVRHPTTGTGTSYLVGQWSAGQREWKIVRNRTTGRWYLGTSTDGTAETLTPFTSIDTPATGADETWALSVLLDNGFGGTSLRAYRRQGGDDLNPLYFPADAAQSVAALPWANRTSPVSVGTSGAVGETWPGRIYAVELAAGSAPTPKGSTSWLFDVSDTVAGTTGWTDPRGRTWTVAGAPSGHVHPATIPAVPATPGDICPAGWEVTYDRMDLATAVELNRVLPNPVPRMRYTLMGTVSGTPVAGFAMFNATDQMAANIVRFNVITGDGTNVEGFLRNLVTGVELRLSDVGDTTNNTRQYTVTGSATRFADGSGGFYYSVPIAWVEGLTAIGGVIDAAATFVPPAPYVVVDLAGQALYGTETYPLTDLVSIDGALFPDLANRVLATRGYTAMPRLEAVTLDAKASRGDMATMETMALCRPEEPTRYTCRLNNDGRLVFDRNMFAVGTQHHIERSEWTLRIALDDAAWAEEPGDLFAFGVIATPTGPTTFAFETTEATTHTTTWRFGDGNTAQAPASQTVTHTYDEAGLYIADATCHRIEVYTPVLAGITPGPLPVVGDLAVTQAEHTVSIVGTTGGRPAPSMTASAVGKTATARAVGFPVSSWVRVSWGNGQNQDLQTNAAGEGTWQYTYPQTGTFTITATQQNGAFLASCPVTIAGAD